MTTCAPGMLSPVPLDSSALFQPDNLGTIVISHSALVMVVDASSAHHPIQLSDDKVSKDFLLLTNETLVQN